MTPDANMQAAHPPLEKQEEISRKLRQSKERFDQLAEQSHTFIWEVDTRGMYTYVSHTVKSVVGYSPEEMIGRYFHEFAPESDKEEIKKEAMRVMTEGVAFTNLENIMLSKTGGQVWVVTNGLPMRGENGEIIGYRGMDMEITERKTLEAELRAARARAEEAYQAKTDFLGNMSYEIRTPMTSLLGYINLLESTDLDDEQRSYVNSACESARMLMMILENILDFNQMEARAICLKSVHFSLRELMESCMLPVSGLVCKKQLEMVCTVDPDVPDLIRGDPFRLRQILNHLLHNAVKFTDRGEVLVSCSRQTPEKGLEQLCFEISDTGPGLPPEALKSISINAPQANSSNGNSHANGVGLGLSVCLRLVSLMGGQMGVTPRRKKGSRCWFTIPLERAEHQDPANPVILHPFAEQLKRQRVLVVEDNPSCRDQLTRYFNSFGMEVHAVGTAFAALRLLETSYQQGLTFDAAFIDQDLPEQDGSTLGRSLRADDRFNSIAIFFMASADTRPPPSPDGKNGYEGYVCKPVRESVLRQALSQFLQTTNPVKPHADSNAP